MGNSSSVRVKPEGLEDAIMNALKEYTDDVIEGTKEATEKAAKTVKNEIQKNAPSKSGKYKKSWSTKKTIETSVRLEMTVYSPKRYMLAHLIEKGHVKKNGNGTTKAQAHIAPAEQKGIKQLEEDIKKIIQS